MNHFFLRSLLLLVSAMYCAGQTPKPSSPPIPSSYSGQPVPGGILIAPETPEDFSKADVMGGEVESLPKDGILVPMNLSMVDFKAKNGSFQEVTRNNGRKAIQNIHLIYNGRVFLTTIEITELVQFAMQDAVTRLIRLYKGEIDRDLFKVLPLGYFPSGRNSGIRLYEIPNYLKFNNVILEVLYNGITPTVLKKIQRLVKQNVNRQNLRSFMRVTVHYSVLPPGRFELLAKRRKRLMLPSKISNDISDAITPFMTQSMYIAQTYNVIVMADPYTLALLTAKYFLVAGASLFTELKTRQGASTGVIHVVAANNIGMYLPYLDKTRKHEAILCSVSCSVGRYQAQAFVFKEGCDVLKKRKECKIGRNSRSQILWNEYMQNFLKYGGQPWQSTLPYL